jgi:tetratricopeptide (TPR) repeat protein
VAEAIEARYGASLDQHTSAQAHHLYQAGAAADAEKTTRYLVAAAGEATAAAAHEDALRHIENALSLWEGEQSPRVADLVERRGRALRSLGRPHEAIYALHRAVDMWDAGANLDRLVAAALSLLGAYAWQAEADAGLEVADAVLARLSAAPPAARFPLVQMRAVLLALSGRIDEALQQYSAATSLREQARSAQLDVMALSVEPHFRWIVSDLEGAAGASRAAAAALEAAGQRWMAVDVAWVAPFSEYFLGRIAVPAELDAMIAHAGQVGHAGARSSLLQVRTALALSAGDLDAAETFARESADLSRESSNRWGYFSMLLHGLITMERGRVEKGLVQDALTWEPESYWVRYGHWTRFLALAQAAPAEAPAAWEALPVRLPQVGVPNPLGAWGNLSHVVLALALLGRCDEVARLEPLAEAQVAAGLVWPMWMSLGRTVAGVASGCAGHWDAAEAHFQAAIALADEAPHRHAQPDARYWHADMLIHRGAPGDRERARPLLDEAAAQANAIGLVLTGRRIHALAERAGL